MLGTRVCCAVQKLLKRLRCRLGCRPRSVCVYCLYVCLQLLIQPSPFFCVCYSWPWLDHPLVALRYVMNSQFYGWSVHITEWPRIDDAKRHIGLLKMTQRGFDSATYTRTDPPWGSTVWCLWLPCYCSGRQTRLVDWLMELWSAVHCRTKRRRRHKPMSYRYSAHFGSQQDLASLLPSSSLSLDPWTSSTLHRTAASPTVLNRLRNTQTPIYLSNRRMIVQLYNNSCTMYNNSMPLPSCARTATLFAEYAVFL